MWLLVVFGAVGLLLVACLVIEYKVSSRDLWLDPPPDPHPPDSHTERTS